MASPPRSPSSPHRLRRNLGLLDAVGIGFGAIVGAGIFVVVGVAAEVAGPALLVALLLAAVAATCNALSSAELAASFPEAGGTYEYGYRLLHPLAGFAAGWMFLVSKTAAASTVAKGLAGYLEAVVPGLPPRAVAVAAILVFTALNYFGVERSSRVNLAMVAISLVSLLLFAGAGASAFRLEHFHPFAPAGWRGVLEASAILFFAYTGYARIATLGEEVYRPERTIPRAIVITLVATSALYLAVALVAVGAAGAPALAPEGSAAAAPLYRVARSFPLPWIALAVAVGGVVAMLGVVLSQLLGLSRMTFAMARRGDLPSLFAAVDPRWGVPGRAVLAIGLVAAAFAAVGTLRGVTSVASFAILLYYGVANVAALRLPRAKRLYPTIVPVVGVVACAVLACSLPWSVIATGVVALGVGLVQRGIVRFGPASRARG